MVDGESQKIVQQLQEQAWNQGNVALLDDRYVPDRSSRGREAFKSLVTDLRTAFPDLQMTLEHCVATGDTIAMHWTLQGTHQGPLRAFRWSDAARGAFDGPDLQWPVDLPPTGQRMSVDGVAFLRTEAGRIVSAWVLLDRLKLLQQLGGLPLGTRRL